MILAQIAYVISSNTNIKFDNHALSPQLSATKVVKTTSPLLQCNCKIHVVRYGLRGFLSGCLTQLAIDTLPMLL